MTFPWPGLAFAIGMPLFAAIVWGLFRAPRARFLLEHPVIVATALAAPRTSSPRQKLRVRRAGFGRSDLSRATGSGARDIR